MIQFIFFFRFVLSYLVSNEMFFFFSFFNFCTLCVYFCPLCELWPPWFPKTSISISLPRVSSGTVLHSTSLNTVRGDELKVHFICPSLTDYIPSFSNIFKKICSGCFFSVERKVSFLILHLDSKQKIQIPQVFALLLFFQNIHIDFHILLAAYHVLYKHKYAILTSFYKVIESTYFKMFSQFKNKWANFTIFSTFTFFSSIGRGSNRRVIQRL